MNLFIVTFDGKKIDKQEEIIVESVERDRRLDFLSGMSLENMKERPRSFSVVITDSDELAQNQVDLDSSEILDGVLAMAHGHSVWGWLYVRTLWVEENFRDIRMGSDLLREVEIIAKQRNCHGIHLETWSKEALSFYEKNGFQLWGMIEDFPKGHVRYSLSKRID